MINKIELSDEQKEKIVTLTEKSLENNDTVINLRLTKQKVDEIRKCGISIIIDYGNGKYLKTVMSDDKIKIKKVEILSDDKHDYMTVYFDGGHEIYIDFPKEIF